MGHDPKKGGGARGVYDYDPPGDNDSGNIMAGWHLSNMWGTMAPTNEEKFHS